MINKEIQDRYNYLLNLILNRVDFNKLDESCNSWQNEYARFVLSQMHDAFVETHGTDHLDNYTQMISPFANVDLPAVIMSQKTGRICLGIVTLDLLSSAEHWRTFFFTPLGIIDQSETEKTLAQSEYISKNFIPYDYWYTISIYLDNHLQTNNMPKEVYEILSVCG